MASRTIAPMSILAEPRRVRRSFAARRIWSKTSVSSSTPLARGIDPSALHARRASSDKWKSGAAQRTPPPATACAIPSNSPRICTPSRMSAGADSPSVRPQWPPTILPP
eukprot:1901611-Pleurochrysis_carterae.AAC.1